MNKRSAFDLDCNPIIPDCGFQCQRCVQQIETVIARIKGVDKVYMESSAEAGKIIVEHDPAIATPQQILETFKKLPTFYDGRFIPTLSAQS